MKFVRMERNNGMLKGSFSTGGIDVVYVGPLSAWDPPYKALCLPVSWSRTLGSHHPCPCCYLLVRVCLFFIVLVLPNDTLLFVIAVESICFESQYFSVLVY